jgi:transposase InsO family protein
MSHWSLDLHFPVIETDYQWENGYRESLNGKMRDEFVAREIFYSVKKAQLLIEMGRRHYNTMRPHSSLRYRPQLRLLWLVNLVHFR